MAAQPWGGKVYFDGVYKGETPVVIENLEKRVYDLEKKDGYEVYKDKIFADLEYQARSFYLTELKEIAPVATANNLTLDRLCDVQVGNQKESEIPIGHESTLTIKTQNRIINKSFIKR